MQQQMVAMQQESQRQLQQMQRQQMLFHQAQAERKLSQRLTIEEEGESGDQYSSQYVPLRQLDQQKRDALTQSSALAKVRDKMFELVVNLSGYSPEDVEILCEGQVGTQLLMFTTTNADGVGASQPAGARVPAEVPTA